MLITRDYSGSRLDKLTSNLLGLPHSLASKLIRKGQIKVNNKKAEISTRLIEGDILTLPNSLVLTPKQAKKGENFVSEKMMQEFKESIIFENDDFFAINKPSGLATQGGSGVKLSVDDFLAKINPEYRLVHRLDKETSGVLIIAKNRYSASQITKDFREKAIKKQYLALTNGIPDVKIGSIKENLAKKEMHMKIASEGLESISHYKVLQEVEGFALIEIEIETGRMHQIRVHLASLGCKIVGDARYGDVASVLSQEIKPKMLLHAFKIEYNNTEIRADLPSYFKNLIKRLDK
jgi:23S rRNA pseudouridine955/2504/2580 synthase